ncbi:MAG: hypothetical protein A3G36_03230 [Omnitrophica bacterium RIFCSPLOWO2_12_FULL_45_13]|nr:MAG: hypothetical protein A3G36_03230 [Omnitrophica bacterium RIFCSPLOWO2_12_FULL_45_13]
MNLFAIAALTLVLTCLGLGFLVFRFGHEKLHWIWGYFNIVVATWGFGCFIAGTTSDQNMAIFGWKIAFAAGMFISILFFHMVCVFCKAKYTGLIILGYLQAIILNIINLGFDRVVTKVRYVYGIYYVQASEFLIAGILLYLLLVTASFLELIKFFGKVAENRRTQLSYVIIGFFCGFLGGTSTFLPMLGIDSIYPAGNFGIVLYCIIVTYAILRHQLLDIEVIVKKTIIFSGLFTAAYTIFAFFALLSQALFEKYIIENRWVSLIPSVFVVTIMLRPLENYLVTVTDKYLFQKKYDYKELLKTFMSEVLTVLEIDKLVMLTKEKLEKTMKLEYCGIVITDKDDKNIVYNSEIKLKIPITLNDKAIGALLLGKKKSDEEYTKDDIDILQSLTRALGIAISNAKLFDELARTQAEMAQKDKMATVGTLAASMAHEIRNPITTIRVFSEYVPDRLKDTEFTNKYKDIVVKEVDKIDHIIQTLIDFSGDDSAAEIEMVSLEESIDELTSLTGLDKDMLDKIDFVKEIPANISKIRVNRKELDGILLNLIQNAMHAIEGKGRITFKAEEKNEFVELDIIDTGCGMSDDIAKNIFNPFFTTRSEGFGLGLFVVKQLVKRNGGTISVESTVGQGTKFRLRFKKSKILYPLSL